ncbi:hypothetical protein FEM48_Zijuj04G0125000 [Ziziphus jujuba var. spinosa]|uniref:Uncharacterized protein n=1 Tax=Ziziphus jujuba var. spinosa TaxID=714518 RepID=A0A978VJW4_ZIZJJ|nr:hypothetical protein FEM48_Zijuj04G0125000 [Ziziphus jujuba var. spinosa]
MKKSLRTTTTVPSNLVPSLNPKMKLNFFYDYKSRKEKCPSSSSQERPEYSLYFSPVSVNHLLVFVFLCDLDVDLLRLASGFYLP